MFNKLKEVLNKNNEEQAEQQRKRSIDIAFITPDEIKQYRKKLENVKVNIQQIEQINNNSTRDLKEFIRQQEKKKLESKAPEETNQSTEQEEEYTIKEDLEEVVQLLKDVINQLNKVQQTQEEIKDKVKNIALNQSPERVKELQANIAKYEAEIRAFKTSEENHKDILNTLKLQTQLFSKETKDLQEKNIKLEKQLNEKVSHNSNLMEQKNILLQMRNKDSQAKNPEIENLKGQLQEFDKRLALQKTKLQQKQKQIEVLKKKLDQDRESLEKIADQLKQKELKSKKILDKYQRSKTEIRKYREEKTEFIKKLNLQIANLSDRLLKAEVQSKDFKILLEKAVQKNEYMEGEISKNEGRGVELESVRSELIQVRKQLMEISTRIQERQAEIIKLSELNHHLQTKRKSLLENLEKPISHEKRTLEKIIKALEKLYKEYITIVFDEGNVVGFQNRITYILSNVREIREDLEL